MFTVDMVQEFLASKGMAWRKEYINPKTSDCEEAKEWRDIVSKPSRLTSLKLYAKTKNNEYDYYAKFLITSNTFQQYNEEVEIMGSGSQISLARDYSDSWLMFLYNKMTEIDEYQDDNSII